MKTRSAAAIPAAAVLMVLTACGVVAPPADGPASSVSAIAGTWILTRTVVADDSGLGFDSGTQETRYVVIQEPGCEATSCTGVLGSSIDEAYLEGGAGIAASETTYTFDGRSLSYTFDPSPIDCVDAEDDSVVVAAAWLSTPSYELEVAETDADSVDSFEGTATAEWAGQDPAALEEAHCAAGGVVTYDVVLSRV